MVFEPYLNVDGLPVINRTPRHIATESDSFGRQIGGLGGAVPHAIDEGLSGRVGIRCRHQNRRPANGAEVNPRGQGSRAEADAVFDFTSRLGRRTEAGPRRVLPRVSPPLFAMYSPQRIGNAIGLKCRFNVWNS